MRRGYSWKKSLLYVLVVGGKMGRMKDLAIDELNRLADESSDELLEDEESWYVDDDYLFTEEND